MGEAPQLFPTTKPFPCGYGPRSIGLSKSGDRLFAGCKDGSLLEIDLPGLLRGEESPDRSLRAANPAAERAGVRAIYDLENGWLLLGDDHGGLTALSLEGIEISFEKRKESGAKPEAPVVGIDEWDGEHLLVSYRGRDARLCRLEEFREACRQPGERAREVAARELRSIQAVRGLFEDLNGSRVIVSESGALWEVKPEWRNAPPGEGSSGIVSCDALWGDFERPGFIWDTALIPAEDGRGRGLYLSTDLGVYLLRWPELGQPAERSIHPVLLPGITGVCMSVSYAWKGSHAFLWVSDLAGDVHLFWDDAQRSASEMPLWKRLSLRLDVSQVMRSLVVPGKGQELFLLGQTCRNDRVLVTSYQVAETFEAPSDSSEIANLLSHGTWERLEAWTPPRIRGDEKRKKHFLEERRTWCPETRFAEIVEESGENLDQLTHFLANPGVDLAGSVLKQLGGSPERAAQALLLWTHTFIGVVNRQVAKRSREQQYLGIIRWLRALGAKCSSGSEGDLWKAKMTAAVERCIRQVRKWGIFGSVYKDRRSVRAPLVALARHQEEDRKIDYMVYSTLLFGRRVDVEFEAKSSSPIRSELTPWDIRHFRSGQGERERDILAVSWQKSGVEIYERRRSGASAVEAGSWTRSLTVPVLRRDGEVAEQGYSRKVILGAFGSGPSERVYLLHAPAKTDESEGERVYLSWIDLEARTGRYDAWVDLPKGESVYSMLELGGGSERALVLLGLQGIEGKSVLRIVEVGRSGQLRLLNPEGGIRHLSAAYPELRSIKRNPVWSLAVDPSEKPPSGHFAAVAGCGDGQIWKVEIEIGDEDFRMRPVLVGRLGAPVWALSYRVWGGQRAARIVAGGADGTIVGFEWVPDGGERGREDYATLWATREEGPVARIHAFESALEDEKDLVLGITQQGIALLISDREKVSELKEGPQEEQQRVRVPGERLGRFKLGSTIFGSVLLEVEDPEEGLGEEPVVRLAVASGEGKIRILTLHHPKYTDSRREKFLDIYRSWLEILKGSQPDVQGHLLRQAEAMHAAAPHLPGVMVRWILWPKEESMSQSWQERHPDIGCVGGPGLQWLPRHLQPLVELDHTWTKGEPLQGKLKAALLAARSVEDFKLFKEIVEVSLNRANHQLFKEARAWFRGDTRGNFALRFAELLADLDQVNVAWLGWPDNLETRIRIIMAKNLVDGDALWSISENLRKSEEETSGEGAKEAGGPRWVMNVRVQQLHQFLAAGDFLLALETLRAANLALIRACRRLGDKGSLHWDAIRGYYEAVGDFAARAAHSARGDLGEAMVHEICRAYAIGMLVCPGSTLRLIWWLCEADLPEEILPKIDSQIRLLETLLGRRIGDIYPKAYSYFDHFMLNRDQRRIEAESESAVGEDNLRLTRGWAPFGRILHWLDELTRQLVNDAGSVNLLEIPDLLEALGTKEPDATEAESSEEPPRDQYFHSRNFWWEGLNQLGDLLKRAQIPVDGPRARDSYELVRPRPVRPDLVLFSMNLAGWCREQRLRLRTLKEEYKIFEPHYQLYDEALSAVERAAKRFREGASLQKNMVLGVLGHSLLELLDEHLLELWEIAQALDPKQTWDQEEGRPASDAFEPRPRAARFASYLLSTSQRAEVIPKNLRNLQGLLSYPTEEVTGVSGYTLKQLLKEFSWAVDDNVPQETLELKLDPRPYHFLRLTLRELAQNHEFHGHTLGHTPAAPVISVPTLSPLELTIAFDYDLADLGRLQRVRDESENLQTPVEPYEKEHSKSHGTGLYLANLAAAAVGWKLELGDFEKIPGRLPFLLRKVE